MRRGGTRHPPRPRAPAAALQAPPSSHARGRCAIQILVTLRTTQLVRYQVFPGKEKILGREGTESRHRPGTSQA